MELDGLGRYSLHGYKFGVSTSLGNTAPPTCLSLLYETRHNIRLALTDKSLVTLISAAIRQSLLLILVNTDMLRTSLCERTIIRGNRYCSHACDVIVMHDVDKILCSVYSQGNSLWMKYGVSNLLSLITTYSHTMGININYNFLWRGINNDIYEQFHTFLQC